MENELEARELIQDLERRRASMDQEYTDWEPHFMELRNNIQPTRGRFWIDEKRQGSTINKKIIDSAGKKGLRTLKSGMKAGMTSPSRPWFKLGLFDDVDTEDPAIKEYLHVSQKRMYTVLRGSNVYSMFDAAYADLGLYGTFGGILTGDFDDVIKTHSFPMGLYRIAANEDGIVDMIHWDTKMTVRNLVNKFGMDNVSVQVKNRYKNNDLHSYVDVRVAIEVRMKRDPNSPFSKDMPVAAYYWERGKRDQMLSIGGYSVNGILGPRWESIEGETWSVSSPGMDALGDCVALQQQHRDKAIAIQKSHNPHMQAPGGFKGRFRNVPGGMAVATVTDLQKGGLRPTNEVRPDISGLLEDIHATQARISESFYEDLFRMTSRAGIEGVKNVTATAIAEMHEEKLIALGPVLESLNNGLLTPVITSTFHYMQEAGILPDPPPSLADKPIKVEFISLMAQAQKAVGVAAIERTIGFAGSMAQIKPEVLDKIDADATMDEFADLVGPPPKILVTTADAQKARQARVQAQQQQAVMENAQPLANAANLISEANQRGSEGLGGV